MTDAFSDYVALLGDVEQIPVAARVSRSLSTEQRAATVAQVIKLVRDRVLPQSDREQAALNSLFVGPVAIAEGDEASEASAWPACDDAIVVPADELADADPRDAARVQALLYRVHAAIAKRFGEAELMFAAAEERPIRQVSVSAPADPYRQESRRKREGPSQWFG